MDTTVNAAEGLRAWAKGLYPTEAAVELAIRWGDGWLAAAYQPWVIELEDGFYRLDAEELLRNSGAFSGGERRVVAVIASLLDQSECKISLAGIPSGVDRDALNLILAAIAHAGGSHEHSVARFNDDRTAILGFDQPGSLHPWPEEH